MKKWLLISGVLLASLAVFLGFKEGGNRRLASEMPSFEVKRGDLTIDVLEGGNIQALDYREFRNQVKLSSGVKILEVIDEGYEVTPEDVKNGKILVRLDSSGIEEAIVDHDVQFEQTQALYAEAKQNIDITETSALSDIKAARQALRFALLDFEKFVGAEASGTILKKLGMPYDNETLEVYEKKATALIVKDFDAKRLAESAKQEIDEKPFTGDSKNSLASAVDFDQFLRDKMLGDGEAEQTIRRMRDEALVASSQLNVVSESVAGAKRLKEKDFITKQTLETELVNLDKAKLTLQTKETDLELFQEYEFPKEAEKMLSKYEEALLALIREKRESMAKMSQVYSKFRSYKRRYELELKKRENLEEQLAGCIIRAEVPGLVAYGSAENSYYRSRSYDAISEGTTLKTGQPIITIPDMSKLGVEVNIHESHIKKISLGQKVLITAESVPDEVLNGTVAKVAVLPDSNASRYNPSLKVYPATIEIEGTHDFLKPGMTAKVEIIVKNLKDVIFIPIQSVFVEGDNYFVFLRNGTDSYQHKQVTVGENNDEFIEVKEGLSEGQSVLLKMPDDYQIKQLDGSRRRGATAGKGKPARPGLKKLAKPRKRK